MYPRHLRLGFSKPGTRQSAKVGAAFGGSYPAGYNARKNAVDVARLAQQIADAINDGTQLPGWAEDWLAVARFNLDQIDSFLQYERGIGPVGQGQFGAYACGDRIICQPDQPCTPRRRHGYWRFPFMRMGTPRRRFSENKYYPPTR